MAEALIEPLVGRLQDLAVRETKKLVAVNEDIRSLRDKLMWMQAFLRDTGPQRRVRNDELIRVYLQQTRDTVFDAEDTVDMYFHRVDLSRFPSFSQATIKFFADFITQVRARRNLSGRIRSINTRLENIIANRDKYKMEVSLAIIPWTPSTTIGASAEKLKMDFVPPMVGRDDKLELLKRKLKAPTPTKRPMVISVVGKSGVGKTMLVKEMYARLTTKNYFDVQAWVTCTANLSAPNILRLILQNFVSDSSSKDHRHKENLSAALMDTEKRIKKYLLVIDAEISNTEWKSIQASLPDGNESSRVVRTTQVIPEEGIGGGFEHEKIELDHFDKENCTQLILKTLFMEEKTKKHNGRSSSVADTRKEKLEKAVNEKYAQLIFNITAGLPLAVVLLSGLLRTKEYPGEWKKVSKHWRKFKESKRLDMILSMCFDDLPHDLKTCFLYFAVLPVNSLIRARTLVCMWMAEGFLRPREGKTMEQVGEQYLKELIDRCLVILPPNEYAAPGFEKVTVQTKVHDFLLLEAQEAKFVEIHSGDDVPTLSTTRRLSLQNHRDKYAALSNPLPKLRSVFSNFENEEPVHEQAVISELGKMNDQQNHLVYPFCLPRCKDKTTRHNPKDLIRNLLKVSEFLRVISLDGLEVGEDLPSEIGNVVHLQYLGITSCSLRKIPRTIGKLKRLLTLDVRGTMVTTLPKEFWRIRMLRHVFASGLQFPKRVGHLQQLQTLGSVTLPDGWDKKNLNNMKRLQTLHIKGLSAKNAHDAILAICKLKYLVLLTIDGEKTTQELFTSSSLPRLQVMDLEGEMSETPQASIRFNLPNLTQLSLENTKVPQGFIDKLGGLPFLSTLALYPGSCSMGCIVFSSGFLSLKNLTLDVKMNQIEIKGPAFPHIENLEIFTYVEPSDFNLVIEEKGEEFWEKITIDEERYNKSVHHPNMLLQ